MTEIDDVFRGLKDTFREIYEQDIAKEAEAAERFDEDFLLDINAQVRRAGKYAPMWGKHHTEEHKERVRQSLLGPKNHNWGKPLSEGAKEKLRQGRISKHLSEETKRRIGRANIGKHQISGEHREKLNQAISSQETREKIRQAHIGKHPSKATREKMRLGRLGPNNHNWGKHFSEETRE